MIQITANIQFSEEKTYILKTLLKDFLGLECTLIFSDTETNYRIVLSNGNELIVEDHFFSKYDDSLGYLDIENLPSQVTTLDCDETNDSIKVLFGQPSIQFSDKRILLGADLFASAFFMLTRWEEYVNLERDQHHRFPSDASIASKNDFLHRPIVNEYIEFIWKLFIQLGICQERAARKFQFTMTHDVDLPRLWWNKKDLIKSLAGSILKRRDLKEGFQSIKNYLKGNDPFNTFDYLMDISEKNGVKSHFFFMSGGTSSKDNYYKIGHPVITDLIKNIDARGHEIGFHPSFNAYNDAGQFRKELKLLKEVSRKNICIGRHHCLRFEVPTTWQIWEDNNMKWDSSMSYHDSAGFRSGVCYPYNVFNILTRKELNLVEKPLTVMEGSFVTYAKMNPNETKSLLNFVKISSVS